MYAKNEHNHISWSQNMPWLTVYRLFKDKRFKPQFISFFDDAPDYMEAANDN